MLYNSTVNWLFQLKILILNNQQMFSENNVKSNWRTAMMFIFLDEASGRTQINSNIENVDFENNLTWLKPSQGQFELLQNYNKIDPVV